MAEAPLYRDLYFGMSDSRNEFIESREEFVRSYVDLNDASKVVRDGQKFLILGPKGTGKSALAWYLEATEDNGTHLAMVRDAQSLPLAEIPRLQTGQAAGAERTVVAWKFVLLCNYLELLLRDQGCSIQQDGEVLRVVTILRDYGFIGDTTGRALTKFANSTIEIPIPKLGTVYRRETSTKLNIYNLIPYLEEWVAGATASVRHVLLLDGLDSIFLNDEQYDESLSSLVQAAYAINQRLRENRATGSVVLLIRNDVFSRIALSLPDSQKMRDDLSYDLDWRILSGPEGTHAPLVQLVNAKAARAAGVQSIDILGYFPEKVSVGGRQGKPRREFPTFQYLLNMTRHTPRDVLRIFEEIRKCEASGVYEASRGHLSAEVIHEGVLQYSTKYFVGAISNEFAGYAGGPESAAAAIRALKAVGKQHFDAEEFRAALAENDSEFQSQCEQLLRLLFFAGAIGNYVAGRDQSYMQFFHRRDDSEIYLKGAFILHHALIHAWGLRWTGGPSGRPRGKAGNKSSKAPGRSRRQRNSGRRRRGESQP